jgi:dGTPase
MRDHGGFEHNKQSLRVVELLENAYPDFPGLNLTFEVREGLQKHERASGYPTLEAQVADLADEITYYSHDLDDAVDFEILTGEQLSENEVWKRSQQHVLAHSPDAREPELHKLIIRNIIDVQVQDVVTTSSISISKANPKSANDVRKQSAKLIDYSDALGKANQALRKFLYANVYYHPRVAEVNRRACEMLKKVFESYIVDPTQLGEVAMRRLDQEGLHRTVCDYAAGMTDRYLMEEYARITGDTAVLLR